jgi:hypothetical protein
VTHEGRPESWRIGPRLVAEQARQRILRNHNSKVQVAGVRLDRLHLARDLKSAKFADTTQADPALGRAFSSILQVKGFCW